MSNGAEDEHTGRSRHGHKLGLKRRALRWWYGSAFYRGYRHLANGLYNWWHPVSDSSRSYYGRYGRSRHGRLRQAWRGLQHWVRNSVLMRAWRYLVIRFYDWWNPVSEHKSSRPGYGYYGHQRHNRAALLLRWLVHGFRRSPVARLWARASNAFSNWWYPLVDDPHAYRAYGYQGRRRRSRLALGVGGLRRWWRHTWLWRAWERVLMAAWEWWFPEVEGAGGGYGYGYSGRYRVSRLSLATRRASRWWRRSWLGQTWRRASSAFWEWYYPMPDPVSRGYGYGHRRVSRPVRFLRRSLRWFRKTWLGRKLKWLLDDLEDLSYYIGWRIRQDFGWWRIRQLMTRWQTWAVLVSSVTVINLAYFYGLPRYRELMEYQYSQQAQIWLRKGDLARAMLRARQTLSLNQSNAIANRVFGDVADQYNSPYAVYWRQRSALFAPSSSNQLALASTALKFEAFPFPIATKALNEVNPETRATPDYHLTAAAMALKMNNLEAAEQHYAEALKLSPDNPAARLSMAVVRLHSKDARIIADSRTTLELLRTDRSVGLLALRSLVAESVDRGDLAHAELLSEQVLTNAQARCSDRILHLAILKAAKRPAFRNFLKETQEQVSRNVLAISEVVAWMNSAGFAREALDWLDSLPKEVSEQGFVPISKADAYVALEAWKELDDYLLNTQWPELEHVRFAMLTFSRWKQVGGPPPATTWNMALRTASYSPGTLSVLADLANAWKWTAEVEFTLWFAVDRFPDEAWPLQALDRFYMAHKDSAGFRRVCAARLQQNPEDLQAKNNYAMISLLMNKDLGSAYKVAEELWLKDPHNPVFVSTHAFSLHLQGRTKEAISLLNALGSQQLDDPSLALYYGIVLAADGQTGAAQPYLKRGTNAFIWPEEEALLRTATSRLE